MSSEFDYWSVWLVYLTAGAGFYWVFHLTTRTAGPSWWLYSLRGLYFALALTPAYANDQGSSLAPALMVTTLDLITIGPEALSRALIPLLLGISLSVVIASAIFVYRKKKT
ncbi:MAG: hypothetical protein AB8B95_01505 [Pseudohongiellaceae bacterium]